MAGDLRLAELLAPLSLVTDLGMGNPPEEAMRACVVATGLARAAGLSDEEVAHVYWTSLLRHVGCTASSHEEAIHVGGDERGLRPLVSRSDWRRPADLLAIAAATARAVPIARRPGVLISSFGSWGEEALRATCEVGTAMADRLGMPAEVQAGLGDVFERWDGKGSPRRLAAEDIAPPARFAQVASTATAFEQVGGPELATEVVRRRAGTMLDPALAEGFDAETAFAELADRDVLDTVLEAEPSPARTITTGRIDDCALAFADMVDLKTIYTYGHSTGVAELAEHAGRSLGMDDAAVADLRRAALLHDLGRVSVANGIWERPGPLGAADREAVRLHPHHTERILSRSPALAGVASLAGMHHERLDGSGYHRQASGSTIPMPARVLAAADAYQAMTQERPHRAAHPAGAAADTLVAEGQEGRLDPEAVRAVLEAAGHAPRPQRRTLPGGLSEREAEVLRLLSAGLSNKEIGKRLFISTRTAESHVQHIYAKIGISTRAGAAMFAMRHDLVA